MIKLLILYIIIINIYKINSQWGSDCPYDNMSNKNGWMNAKSYKFVTYAKNVCKSTNSSLGCKTLKIPKKNIKVNGTYNSNIDPPLINDGFLVHEYSKPSLSVSNLGISQIFVRGKDNTLWMSFETKKNSKHFDNYIQVSNNYRLHSSPTVVVNKALKTTDVWILGRYENNNIFDKYSKKDGKVALLHWIFNDNVKVPKDSLDQFHLNRILKLEIVNTTFIPVVEPQLHQTGPAVHLDNEGFQNVFLWGADQRIYRNIYNYNLKRWVGWKHLGESYFKASSPPIVAANADGRMEVYCNDGDSMPGHFYVDDRSGYGKFTDFHELACFGFTSQSTLGVARRHDGELFVITLGENGKLYVIHQSWRDSSWDCYFDSIGSPSSTHDRFAQLPTITTNSDGRIEIFASYPDGNMYVIAEPRNDDDGWKRWSHWNNLGKPKGGALSVVSQPSAALDSEGYLTIIVRGSTDDLDGSIQIYREKPQLGACPLVASTFHSITAHYMVPVDMLDDSNQVGVMKNGNPTVISRLYANGKKNPGRAGTAGAVQFSFEKGVLPLQFGDYKFGYFLDGGKFDYVQSNVVALNKGVNLTDTMALYVGIGLGFTSQVLHLEKCTTNFDNGVPPFISALKLFEKKDWVEGFIELGFALDSFQAAEKNCKIVQGIEKLENLIEQLKSPWGRFEVIFSDVLILLFDGHDIWHLISMAIVDAQQHQYGLLGQRIGEIIGILI